MVEAILDTGGARSMVDLETAKAMKLDVEKATRKVNFGSFIGPNGRPTYYYGRVKGPITFKFGGDVELTLQELKIIRHEEPLVLVGTDLLMGWEGDATCKFCFVGVHPRTRDGCMIAMKGDKIVEIALVGWPLPVSKRNMPPLPPQEGGVRKLRTVSFGEDAIVPDEEHTYHS